MEIVAEYQGKPSLDMYAQMLYSAGMEYGKCLLVVENNGIGISVFEKLKDIGYKIFTTLLKVLTNLLMHLKVNL